MKVVLVKDIKNFGECGRVKEVKEGYARNYLLPRGLALPATQNSFERINRIKEIENNSREKKKNETINFKELIEKTSLTITAEAKNEEDIYGTIGEAHIVKALKNENIEIKKEQIHIDEPIKKLGVYMVRIDLHPEVKASLRVWVVKK